jgi:hypothetical protein
MDHDACNDLQKMTLHGKQAIAASLLAAGRSSSDVARRIRCDKATIWRWQQEADFRQLVSLHRESFMSEALGKLGAIVTQAVDKLAGLLDSSDESISLKASLGFIDRITSLREHVELSAIVAELEKRIVNDHRTKR